MSPITVTKEQVAENMRDVLVETRTEFDKPVTYVSVRMKNGFTLRESTTCVDPANYDEEIGKQICLKKIEDKVWFLLGYALQEQQYLMKLSVLNTTIPFMTSADYKDRFIAEYIQAVIRLGKLDVMISKYKAGTLDFTPTCPIELLEKQSAAMREYINILLERAQLEKVDMR